MTLDRDSFERLCFCISDSQQQTWFPEHSDLQWTWAQSVPTVADANPTTGNRQAHVQGTEEYGKSMSAVFLSAKITDIEQTSILLLLRGSHKSLSVVVALDAVQLERTACRLVRPKSERQRMMSAPGLYSQKNLTFAYAQVRS